MLLLILLDLTLALTFLFNFSLLGVASIDPIVVVGCRLHYNLNNWLASLLAVYYVPFILHLPLLLRTLCVNITYAQLLLRLRVPLVALSNILILAILKLVLALLSLLLVVFTVLIDLLRQVIDKNL